MGHQQWDAPRTRASYLTAGSIACRISLGGSSLSIISGIVVHPLYLLRSTTFHCRLRRAAAEILERHHAVGTFYAATKLLGAPHPLWEMATKPDLERLVSAGHEIGLHTHEHQHLWRYTPQSFADDMARNTETIKQSVVDFVPSPLPTLMGFAISDIRSGFQTSCGAVDPFILESMRASSIHISLNRMSWWTIISPSLMCTVSSTRPSREARMVNLYVARRRRAP